MADLSRPQDLATNDIVAAVASQPPECAQEHRAEDGRRQVHARQPAFVSGYNPNKKTIRYQVPQGGRAKGGSLCSDLWKRFQMADTGLNRARPILMTLSAMTPSPSDVGAVRGIALKRKADIGDRIKSDENNALFEVPSC